MNNGKITKDNNKVTKTKTTNNNSKKPSSKHLMTGTAIFIAAILVVSGTNIKAFADTVVNDVVSTASGRIVTATAGGPTSSIGYGVRVQGAGADGQGGCNAADGSPAILQFSGVSGMTTTPSTVEIDVCSGTGQMSDSVVFNVPATTPAGSYTVSVTVKDSGNGGGAPAGTYDTSNAGFILSVTRPPDTTPPVVTVPGPIIEEATGPSGATVTFSVSALDETDVGPLTVTCKVNGQAVLSGATFPLGTTTVNCEATDAADNTGSKSFTITVRDTTKPTLNLPASQSIEATGPLGAVFEYTAEATDLVDGAVDVDCSPASGSTFPLGATGTTVSCSATDAAGNTAQGSFTITVVDETEPTLILPSIVNAIAGSSSGAVVTFTKSAEDLVSGSVEVTCTPKDSGDNFPLGTTAVTCIATDAAGNTASGSFDVKVTFPTWSGILQPINADHSSIFKQGSTVPVKFQIPLPGGGFVTDANAKIFIAKVSNGVVEGETEAVTSTPASTGNTFRYDGGQYIYNFGTKSYSAGTYQLRIDIGDGSLNTVMISLKK